MGHREEMAAVDLDLTTCMAGGCETTEECVSLRWYVCEQPERPLDDHGLFVTGCEACDRAWRILGCPYPAGMVPPVAR